MQAAREVIEALQSIYMANGTVWILNDYSKPEEANLRDLCHKYVLSNKELKKEGLDVNLYHRIGPEVFCNDKLIERLDDDEEAEEYLSAFFIEDLILKHDFIFFKSREEVEKYKEKFRN